MRSLSFYKISPTENMTVLVTDPVPRADQSSLASRLMAYDSIGAEQVGFIEPAENPAARARLQMMGGEFCGNAAMSLAAVLAHEAGLTEGDFTLEVSGCPEPVTCRLESGPDGMTGTVSMPLPERLDAVENYPAVFLPGIVHLIAPASDFPRKDEAEVFLRRVCETLDTDAGLMLFNEAAMTMTPCVHVRGTDSAVWERGCASGTAALGAYLAARDGVSEIRVRQPGGSMTARAEYQSGRLAALSVTGSVRIAAKGVAMIYP